jgi:hypothetical protein
MKFIKLTECYSQETREMYFNVEMIQAIFIEGNRTRLKHPSHNNGGWCVKETPEEILKLIKQLN